MYTEFELSETGMVFDVFMEGTVERKDEHLRKVLEAYQRGELDGSIVDRIRSILDKNSIIIGGKLSENGRRLLDKGLVSVKECGEYEVTAIENELAGEGLTYLGLKRKKADTYRDSKKCQGRISGNLFDCDQNDELMVNTTILRSKDLNSINATVCVKVDDGSVVCVVKENFKGTSIEHEFHCKKDGQHILQDCINGYSVERSAMVIKNLADLTDEEISNICKDLTDADLGNLVNKAAYGKQIQSFRSENLALCAADKHIAEEWMDRLRVLRWEERFVSPEMAKSDQEYWSERLLGDKEHDLILRDDQLLDKLRGTPSYWGVASMIDLMPDASVRQNIFISPDSPYNEDITEKMFSPSVVNELQALVIVDGYPGKDSEEVLRYWTRREDLKIIFLANKTRYENSRGAKMTEKDLSSHARLKLDNGEKSESHSRYYFLVKKNGDIEAWNVDSSINQFHMKDGKPYTNSKMKFSPDPCIYDVELEKKVRGCL